MFESISKVFLLARLSAALLDRNGLCDALRTSICLINLSVLSKNCCLQITTVEVINRLLYDDVLCPTEVPIDVSDRHSILGVAVSLGGRLCDKLSTVVLCANNIGRLGVGQSTVLEHTQGLCVALLDAEDDSARSFRHAVSGLEETIVLFHEFPHKLVRYIHHSVNNSIKIAPSRQQSHSYVEAMDAVCWVLECENCFRVRSIVAR